MEAPAPPRVRDCASECTARTLLPVSRARAAGEVGALVATGALFLVFENLLGLKLPFLAVAVAAWLGYLAVRLRSSPGLLKEWGIRWDNAREAARPAGLFLVAAGLGMAAWHAGGGGATLSPAAAFVVLPYVAWAFVQQFGLQALVTSNLIALGWPRAAVVPVAALLFGIGHLPDLPLAGLCSSAGVVWCLLYLRTRNLPVLAVCHAILGTLAFTWVLGRDSLAEMFNR